VLIARRRDRWSNDCVGFQLERRNDATQQVTVLVNRVQTGSGPGSKLASRPRRSSIRRCIWTDHSAVATDGASFSQYAIAELHLHEEKTSIDAGRLIPIWSTKAQACHTLVEAVTAVRL
jgi:hypothetical protein